MSYLRALEENCFLDTCTTILAQFSQIGSSYKSRNGHDRRCSRCRVGNFKDCVRSHGSFRKSKRRKCRQPQAGTTKQLVYRQCDCSTIQAITGSCSLRLAIIDGNSGWKWNAPKYTDNKCIQPQAGTTKQCGKGSFQLFHKTLINNKSQLIHHSNQCPLHTVAVSHESSPA